MYIKTLTVSDINKYIKKVIDNDFILNNSCVKGEISNFKFHSSGHMYFSLKDEYSKINCVMFKSYVSNLKFMPENGMKVVIKGRVSVYQKDGSYQLYAEDIEADGVGELFVAFEKLKNKLENEGLFDSKYKKTIPRYAKKIGIVTSPTGAAIKDIINVAKRRNKSVELLIYPALVQGINSSKDILKGINALNKYADIDVIIVARGGGSIEELWSFNDEDLAREIFKSKIPIITGVGHETDYTIVDFVSDRRAPTPSAAAELAVFDFEDTVSRIMGYKNTFNNYINSYIKEKYIKLNILKNTLSINNGSKYIVNEYENVDKIIESLNYKINVKIKAEKERLGKASALLSAHNPLNILNKGYAVIQNNNCETISQVDVLRKNKLVKITLKDGTVCGRLEIKD